SPVLRRRLLPRWLVRNTDHRAARLRRRVVPIVSAAVLRVPAEGANRIRPVRWISSGVPVLRILVLVSVLFTVLLVSVLLRVFVPVRILVPVRISVSLPKLGLSFVSGAWSDL